MRMKSATERRLLQITVASAGLVPISAGLTGILSQPDLGIGGNPTTNSHFAYLSGLLLGIGLAFWAMIPTIERRTAIVRALTLIIIIGGMARLYAWIFYGTPELPMQLALGMELIVTPALCLWQGRVAKRS